MMSIVDDIYNDVTIRHKIAIELLGIEPISEEDSADLVVPNDPTKTLTNVAKILELYGKSGGRARRGLHEQKDLTVFLTRDSFGPAGKLTLFFLSFSI